MKFKTIKMAVCVCPTIRKGDLIVACEKCQGVKNLESTFLEVDPKEIVICAAVVCTDGTIIRCHRHSDGLRKIKGMPGKVYTENNDGSNQGFITSKNRYVNRKEALRIQKLAGIASVDPDGYRFQLYSEDLY